MRRDYYAVLGVAATAPPREIRQAYRRLARQYSPDVNFWDTTVRRTARQSARQHARDRASVLHPQRRRHSLRAAHQRVGGAARRPHPGADAPGRGGARRAARDAGRPGVPAARPGRAATGRRCAGRSLRHGEGRRAGRARRTQRRARAGARAAAAAHRAWGPRAVPRGDGMTTDRGKPLYMIGVVAEMLKVHPQTLRFYEKKGLVRPSRTEGQTRMYSAEDVEEIARLLRLTRDLGVNLAGVGIILKIRRRMTDMQKQIEDLLTYVRDSGAGEARPERGGAPREALVRAASAPLGPVDLF